MRRSLNVPESVKQPLLRLRRDFRVLTSGLRGFPSTVIIGTQKGGTTSLFSYLVRHPDIIPPLNKEIHYFDLNYGRGVHWYRAHFPYASILRMNRQTLDASPYYMVHPLVPQRLAALLPGAKLIAVLRNPVDRAYSHYQHEVRGGREPLSFAEAIEREPERLAGEEQRLRQEPGYYSHSHHRYSYVLRGLYLEQLRRWVQFFPRSQLLILQSERLFRNPAAVTEAVHSFLGLRPHRLGQYKPFLRGEYQREIPEPVRARLVARFEPYNLELYRWLGEEFDWA